MRKTLQQLQAALVESRKKLPILRREYRQSNSEKSFTAYMKELDHHDDLQKSFTHLMGIFIGGE